jgi:large subunit ribosomal protein L23
MNPYVIKKPIITEKSLSLASTQNIYIFEVKKLANKEQIKAAVEELFKVKVLNVNTVVRAKYLKKTGKKRLQTEMPKTKKALVKLQEGDKIELFDVGGEK